MKSLLLLGVGVLITASSPVTAQPRTFNADVAQILYDHCVACHRPGDIAPFSLLTYEDAAPRSVQIAAATAERRMPPWKPELNYGDFHGIRGLTESEIATLQAWATAGAPRGEAPPPSPPPAAAAGWQLGVPDLVLETPAPFTLAADGPDIYQCFVLPLDLAEDAVLLTCLAFFGPADA